MPGKPKVYTDADGSLFVAEGPGKKPLYVGCVTVPDLPNPKSDRPAIWCLDEMRRYVSVGNTQSPPDTPSLTIQLS